MILIITRNIKNGVMNISIYPIVTSRAALAEFSMII
jgi:hypothetical protein